MSYRKSSIQALLSDDYQPAETYTFSMPYQPDRITPADSVLTPLTRIEQVESLHPMNPLRSSFKSYEDVKKEQYQERRGVKRHERVDDKGVVAGHYNARPETGKRARNDSPIIGLKNFNNWIKTILINRYGRREYSKGPLLKVLDLCCGKGGDLLKWSRAGTREYVGVDIAALSVQQARERLSSIRNNRFQGHFFSFDCFGFPLEEAIPARHLEVPFDVVSIQFAMHYAFTTESRVRQLLSNVVSALKPGGRFIGTIPDARFLLSKVTQIPEDSSDLTFGNSVYQITFDERDCTPRYSHRYTFFLQDAVEQVPEYVVYWEQFVALAREYGLFLTEESYKTFHQVFEEEVEKPESRPLMERMGVMDSEGNSAMNEDQFEAAGIYAVFSFTKEG